ncbi:GTP cyclohydrolase I FolE2 [candidate division KSB1 bacterium]|nr:GTP cyclohydrolase I FolE2 [candidate division KSB1 bacterium]
MDNQKKYLVNVGMQNLPFPMHVLSRNEQEGQYTIANISIEAIIMQEFEARWIDKFIQIVHDHRDRIGTKTLRHNIYDYMKELEASAVTITFDYPFFITKTTPISKQQCLVRYNCRYTAKLRSIEAEPRIIFGMEIPCITTYPGSAPDKPGGLFGQLSLVDIEVESTKPIFPEDLVDIVDKCSLSPIYSFLSEDDQLHIIQKVHTENQSSVMMTDEIKHALAKIKHIDWYLVNCSNYGMLHSYSTIIGTEKSRWVPFSYSHDDDVI